MNLISKNFSPDQNDYLLKALFELAKELSSFNVPLIIGGGLSLYIRTTYFHKVRSPRYPKQTEQRVTKDMDIFLSSDIIVDSAKVQHHQPAYRSSHLFCVPPSLLICLFCQTGLFTASKNN